MAPDAELSLRDDARAFADSVAGVLGRLGDLAPAWAAGEVSEEPPPAVARALEELGWSALGGDPELVAFAGLGAVELGRRLGPLAAIDGLLDGAPAVGDLVRTPVTDGVALFAVGDEIVRRSVLRSEPLASADGLCVHRLLELGDGEPVDADGWPVALDAWLAASVGYLAGVGQGALELTVDYVRQRRAFGTTLAALAPVQQLLAGAATAVRGVTLLAGAGLAGERLAAERLAGDGPGRDALAHAGPAIAEACAACQQVSGAIGYTLEHPLHRFTQRARALSAWNDALLQWLLRPAGAAL
ncbi:MAG: acyl-CoA dehydrogenase family protein [Solirubrobacteraceae bacterium]